MRTTNLNMLGLRAARHQVPVSRRRRPPRTRGGFLAVDVGGTRIKAALWGDPEPRHGVWPTERTPEGVVTQLAQLHAASGSPERWALCLPGPVRDGVWWAHQPFPTGPVPIEEILSQRGLPVPFCCRDCEAALAGEAEGRSIVLIQLGTGIGCGVTVDGAMLSDSWGEPVGLWMAHVPLLSNGAACARCGGCGCASTHASTRGIAEQLGGEISADQLRDRALAGEQPFGRVYERALEAVARLAQMAAMNFRPEDVRLAGGSARAWSEELVPRVSEALAALPQAAAGDTRATLSVRGELAPLQGLVTLAERAGSAAGPCTIPGATPLEAARGWESPGCNSKKVRPSRAGDVRDEPPADRIGRGVALADSGGAMRTRGLPV